MVFKSKYNLRIFYFAIVLKRLTFLQFTKDLKDELKEMIQRYFIKKRVTSIDTRVLTSGGMNPI